LLLSKFLHAKSASDFSESDNWKTVLGESPKQAIERFTNEGMLVQANLTAQLDYRFKSTELKSILRQQGLPVSGHKEDLINRLIRSDPKGMKNAVGGLILVICSENGREIAEQYLSKEKLKQTRLEEQILEYLKQRKFREASIAVAAFEAEQVFPRGIGIDWNDHNPARDMELLKFIFDGKPKIISWLNDEQLALLRIAAGMILLLGTNNVQKWLPPNLQISGAMEPDVAVRMLLFYALHKRDIVKYRQSGVVKKVEILADSSSCKACKKIEGKRFNLDEVIELPYEHCTHEAGCRCTLIAVLT
jgi:hypothetical protein